MGYARQDYWFHQVPLYQNIGFLKDGMRFSMKEVRSQRLRILVVRLSALGDVVLTLPVACELRRCFPEAHLAWAVESSFAPVLEHHPALDEVIVLPRGWAKSWQGIRSVWRTMRSRHFDLVIDVQSLTRSALVAWFTGAKTRIGFARPQGRELAPWMATQLWHPRQTHVVDRFLELLAAVGVSCPQVTFDLHETVDETSWAENATRKLGLQGSYAVINPGAGWPSKLWCPHRFAEVAKYLNQSHGIPVLVLWGNQSERDWADIIVAHGGEHTVLSPATNIRQMMALLRRASLMVGCDTGPLHLAAAVGTPCVGLYGPTKGEETGPYGPNHVIVQAARYHGRHRRKAPRSLMEAITVDMVCQACSQLLSRIKTAA